MKPFVVISRTGTTLPEEQVAVFVGPCSPTSLTQDVWDLAEVYCYAYPQLHLHVWQSEDRRLWYVGNANAPACIEEHATLSGAVKKSRDIALSVLAGDRARAESEYERLRTLSERTQRSLDDAKATVSALSRLLGAKTVS